MIEFIIGLAVGMMISNADLGEPVPYQTITYSDETNTKSYTYNNQFLLSLDKNIQYYLSYIF